MQGIYVVMDGEKNLLTISLRKWNKNLEQLLNAESYTEKKKIVRNCKRNVRAAMKRIKIGETACPNDITVKIWTCSWQSAVDF